MQPVSKTDNIAGFVHLYSRNFGSLNLLEA
jgi:hypothetical protein